MVLSTDHIIQADIVFLIESTGINGAYFQDIKSNYLIPALEFFSQGTIDDRDYGSETTSSAYGIVLYKAADCLPSPCCDTYGPYTNASRVLNTVDKIELVGGKGESHANIAEGLATALLCLEELGQKREPTSPSQRYCILVCNSPPYSMPVMETHPFNGKSADQLCSILQERGIHLSIISPRKIPILFKLYEKAGGDLTSYQTKNYAKDPRHLVLLKGFSLKEHEISPPTGTMTNNQNAHIAASIPTSSMASPMSTSDTALTNVGQPQTVQSNLMTQNVNPNGIFRPNQNPTGIQMPNHQTHPIQMGTMPGPGRPIMTLPGSQQFSNQIPGPPGYHQTPTGVMGARPPPRWPMLPPQQRPTGPYPTGQQSSALIAQLSQPPNVIGGQANQFGNRLEANALRCTLMNNQNVGGCGVQNSIPQQNQPPMPQPQPPQQSVNSPATSVASGVPPGAPPVNPVQNPNQQPQSGQQVGTVRERHTIWKGVLEWIEKAKPNDQEKIKRHVPCQVSANSKDGQPELTATAWPQKLIMQLMPKQLIGNIGGTYLKNSKSVLFHPENCEALDSLTKVMSSGFAGCVHFTSSGQTACDIKVLILLYTAEKRAYLGFIPNDQGAFVDRLRKVIQQQKSNQMLRQGQVGTSGNSMNPNGPNPTMNQQQGTNPGLSGPAGSPSTGGVVPNQSNMMVQQNVNINAGNPPTQAQQGQQSNMMNVVQGNNNTGPRISMSGMPPGTNSQIQTNAGAGGGGIRPGQPPGQPGQPGGSGMQLGGPQQQQQSQQQQRATFDHLARQQNLEKIMQLKQTLEQAQQQEAQYKTQLEIMNHMKTQQLQEALQVAQQQENQYKQQMEQEQQKQLRVQLQQMQQQQQQQRGQMPPQMQQSVGGVAPGQRMMRPGPGPVLSNNPGLRHLLQQQPQYRPQPMGIQQMGNAGPRGPQMPQQNKPNQYDDVSGFDYYVNT